MGSTSRVQRPFVAYKKSRRLFHHFLTCAPPPGCPKSLVKTKNEIIYLSRATIQKWIQITRNLARGTWKLMFYCEHDHIIPIVRLHQGILISQLGQVSRLTFCGQAEFPESFSGPRFRFWSFCRQGFWTQQKSVDICKFLSGFRSLT